MHPAPYVIRVQQWCHAPSEFPKFLSTRMKQLPTAAKVLSVTFAVLLPHIEAAQDTTRDFPEVTIAPVVRYTELSRKTVRFADHQLTLVRVRPPVLPKAPPPPAPTPLTAEQQASMKRLEGKAYASLNVTAVVYLNGKQTVTELRWRDETGRNEYKAFSNADFRYLTQLNQLETETTIYAWFPFVEAYQLSDWTKEAKSPLPGGLDFTPGETEYFVDAEAKDTDGQEATLAGLDYLHAYYKIHYKELKLDYEKRELANDLLEEQLRRNPPKTPDATLRWWPLSAPTTNR